MHLPVHGEYNKMAQQINMGYQRNVMVTVEPRSDDEAGRCHFKFGKGVLLQYLYIYIDL